ncbi:MAG: UDP-N-acetylglucosamine 2-epimerase [Lachnospiraceae bacterium]|nr:UDP-N-acetylglucosamine 2-epimerase [Lachnospiraceae bacterium]
MNKSIYFFIGTEAELIKVFPVVIECQNAGKTCHIIASGQNDLRKSRIIDFMKLNGKFIELSKETDIKKSAAGLLSWFLSVKKRAPRIIKKHFHTAELSGADLIVHGDTVSTMMGAFVGKKLGMRVCHVEAGLRSHNLLNPFPEEIDRLITSRLAGVHFAPGSLPTENLRNAKGIVVNTEYNTILDSLAWSKKMEIRTKAVQDIQGEDYFVFVMHRQENLMNNDFVRQVVKQIRALARERKCVLILHKITENKFNELGILDKLKKDIHFVMMPRVDYFDFMKLLEGAQYVITDGGSNQEELHYMGKPCLIMRKRTERQEGIGENAVMYSGKTDSINKFAVNYKRYQRECLLEKCQPSKIICNTLCRQ